jgi:hypothetical protein
MNDTSLVASRSGNVREHEFAAITHIPSSMAFALFLHRVHVASASIGASNTFESRVPSIAHFQGDAQVL